MRRALLDRALALPQSAAVRAHCLESRALLPSDAPDAAEADTDAAASEAPVETEAYYTFVRAPRRRPDRAPREARKPREGEAPRGGKPRREHNGAGAAQRRSDGDKPKAAGRHNHKPEAGKPPPRPPRVEKPIDPDSPFAALMALKTRS